MSALNEISEYFSRDARVRGEEYFNQGRVSLIKAMNSKVVASVRGSRAYTVTLRGLDSEIDARCTCPFWNDEGPCKHIWATLLKLDEDGLLPEETDGFIDIGAEDEQDDQDEGDESDQVLPPAQRQAMIEQINRLARGNGAASTDPTWKRQLTELQQAAHRSRGPERPIPPAMEGRRIIYVIGYGGGRHGNGELSIFLQSQRQDRSGQWGDPVQLRLKQSQINVLPDDQDRVIFHMLSGASYRPGYFDPNVEPEHEIDPGSGSFILKKICETGRAFVRAELEEDEISPLSWDDGPAWEFCLDCRLSPGEAFYLLVPTLVRGEEQIDCAKDMLGVLDGELVVTRTHVAKFGSRAMAPVMEWFSDRSEPLKIGRADIDSALSDLLKVHPLPRLNLPDELKIKRVTPPMRPKLKIAPPRRGDYSPERLVVDLSFDYAGKVIPEGEHAGVFDAESRTLLVRDADGEAMAQAILDDLKCKSEYEYGSDRRRRRLAAGKLNKVVLGLCAKGWSVEAEGKLYRRAGEFKMEVSSGIDWFDLNGAMDFGGVSAPLPRLLAALKRGEATVQLDDGTMGILPEDWLKKYGILGKLAEPTDEGVRFTRGQVGLLDALLSEMPEASFDEAFGQARKLLTGFDGVAPADPAPGFIGELRPYQRHGLGWLQFLNQFGFGGCLADDMGLGKTIQVLSLLHARRGSGKPSLVVVPRSLVFNWIEEAKRFTPDLKILDHSGVGRGREFEHFKEYDIILTTYGTLRLDAPLLKDMRFDYAILDEAQAIKNGSSESAKAARLVRADHRLAMSGTPVQNHLGELWSLFEFLNPGMLGGASVFKMTGKGNGIEREGRELLARALRPFILRRTKEQVAKDLPEKTEQTIHCEMEPEQRKVYDELREHYRTSLLSRIATEGINKAKIQILEALLRLRQAACHPGLIDKSWIDKPSAKLDAMIPHLCEVIEENHKVLVFSQFTSMLAIVKRHLDKQNIVYEYLDGQTKDRQAKVRRFQSDKDCRVFLISLKAGGLGLNLTAAEYVFLLDPWWNPAIEAQAIDRAHRIGQTRRVFAYRFIASNTVEQKVLELQAKKKDLADMIINADNSLIGQLGKDDLELLLS